MVFVALALCAPLVSGPAAVASAPASPAPRASSAGSVAIRADAVWLGDGRIVEKGTLLVVDGRIADVGANVTVPDGTPVVEHKGVVTAGLIALHGYTGGIEEVLDGTRVAMPDARLVYAFDPSHYDFEDARAAGITSVLLTPSVDGVAPGTTAVVKTSGRAVISDAAHVSLVFTAEGLRANREPTSLAGAVSWLDRIFTDSPTGVIERAKNGALPCLFEASTTADVQRVLAFADKHKLVGAIHGVGRAGEMAEQIRASKLSVIVPAVHVGLERRELLAVANLAKNEVRFGFGLDSPWNHPAQLRLGAAMCVREGLAPEKAWNALTSDAARIAGVDARVGRLDRGLDADFVLWSGSPLDLGSQVVSVFVDGARVAGGAR